MKSNNIVEIASGVHNSTTPLVSIGVPVFNGEITLARALDSLLQQDYSNLEIIISDNGSTDATPDICESYVSKDARIKYYRSANNFGSIWNFNRLFELSNGKYFMWAAHDDLRELSYVSACVEKMEKNSQVVLCQSHTTSYIEGRREILCINRLDSVDSVTDLVDRYRNTLKRYPVMAIYGMYRSSAMRKTRMLTRSIATDLAFIQELSIYGEFAQVPKRLFTYFGREQWNTIHQDYKSFLGKDRKPWWYLPFVALFCNHWQRVVRAPISFSMKLRLWGLLLEREAVQLPLKVLIKVGKLPCPGRWKMKLGCKIYCRWMHNPDVEVGCKDLFLEKVIKPRLGWWQ